ncbi:MAG: hypothetical protein U0359_21470 [Byssovorax sp.]
MVELRLALSAAAAKHLAEPRLRRLLEIELHDSAVLAPGASGPLGDHVAYLWIDEPSAALAAMDVRVGDRPVVHRDIGTAGLSGDVAARLVAIAASEMVRDQLAPVAKAAPQPAAPRKPTPDEIERASRSQPAVMLLPAASAAFLPSGSGALGGVSFGAGFRYLGLGETLSGRWLSGTSDAGSIRWLEVGLGLSHRVWLGRAFRLNLGAMAALGAVHLAASTPSAASAGEHDTWTARAGAIVGGELRVAPAVWLGLNAEPGVLLRPVPYEARAGKSALDGATIGLSLGLCFDLFAPADLSEARAP